ncbi:hypothetical protein V1520DRAFT_338081 [Lipomyces starkeyi]|uniref:Uncharacterized protein n=1 Tax=Lipomyces starkeyi NRRL Y-11557 TaxID=675824 RepID=A0A1E3QCW3_LIPST|nr:hypothetical protein LIPSTDRAFT_61163 [Lipomyces starkeyi NRRL Y-11557]
MARPSETSAAQSSSSRPSSRRRAALIASESGKSRQVSTPTTNGTANGKVVTNGSPTSVFKTPQTSVKKLGHIKFGDEEGGEEDVVNGVQDTPMTGYFTAEEELSDSPEEEEIGNTEESDDDDEAPEDVSFQDGRHAAILHEQGRKREVEIFREGQRAKRNAKDSRLRAQKVAKKAKVADNNNEESVEKEELPLFLPSSILKEVTTTPDVRTTNDIQDDATKKPKPKKTVFSEPEIRDVPKGQITLRVLKMQKLRTMPPPAKTKLLKSREKWLNRKSIRDGKAGHKIII